MASLAFAHGAAAQVLVSNLGQPNVGWGALDADWAQGFVTGTRGRCYRVDSVDVEFAFYIPSLPLSNVLDVAIYGLPTDPTTKVGDLTVSTSVAPFTTNTVINFPAPDGGLMLNEDTRYFVVLDLKAREFQTHGLRLTGSRLEDTFGGSEPNDWTITDYYAFTYRYDDPYAPGYWQLGDNAFLKIAVNGQIPSGPGSRPVFADAATMRSVAENTVPGSNVGAPIAATDDDGDTLTYYITGQDAASFTFDTATGQIGTLAPLDFETKSSYVVEVTTNDGGCVKVTTPVSISVTDQGPPRRPKVTGASAGSATSLNVSWNSPSSEQPILSYDLRYVNKSAQRGTFMAGPQNVVGTSASITGLEPDTLYHVSVRATSIEGDGAWSAETFIGRTNPRGPNNAPLFNDATPSRGVAENTAPGSNVGAAIVATDDDGDTLTYVIGGTDAASFAIDAASGQIRTRTALDFEASPATR